MFLPEVDVPDDEPTHLGSVRHQPHAAHLVPHALWSYLLVQLPFRELAQQGEAGAALQCPLGLIAQLHLPLLQGVLAIHDGARQYRHPPRVCWVVQDDRQVVPCTNIVGPKEGLVQSVGLPGEMDLKTLHVGENGSWWVVRGVGALFLHA